MDFIQLINEQQVNLVSTEYVQILLSVLNGEVNFNDYEEDYIEASLEVYKSHLPLDVDDFLRSCIIKLQGIDCDNIDWSNIDLNYVITFIYFFLRSEDQSTRVHALHLYILLSSLLDGMQVYFIKMYSHVLHILETSTALKATHQYVADLIADFKIFLDKQDLIEDLHAFSIVMVCNYVYFINDDSNNIGHAALSFAKTIIDTTDSKKVWIVLLCLASSLSSTYAKGVTDDRAAHVAHQKYARLFIKNNVQVFSRTEEGILDRLLKMMSNDKVYDDFEGMACLLQVVPLEIHRKFLLHFDELLFHRLDEKRKRAVNHILPFFNHENYYKDNKEKIEDCQRIFRKVWVMLRDPNLQIREMALQVLSECCTYPRVQEVLKKEHPKQLGNLYKAAYQMTDLSWIKKDINKNYIILTCNLILINIRSGTLSVLNELRSVCISASPFNLRCCIPLFKCILKKCDEEERSTILYILEIFIKMMEHPQANSAIFAKELHRFIFTQMDQEFTWNVIRCICSHFIDIIKVIETFSSAGLLSQENMTVLIKHKISNDKTRLPALHLLWALLHYMEYNQIVFLDMRIEDSFNHLGIASRGTTFVFASLVKMMEKKVPGLKPNELRSASQTRAVVYKGLYNQNFPSDCVKHAIQLLSEYSRLLPEEDSQWDKEIFTRIEQSAYGKLKTVSKCKYINHNIFKVDVDYLSDLIQLRSLPLSKHNSRLLKKIIDNSCNTEFIDYFTNNDLVWNSCLTLHLHALLVNSISIEESITTLEKIFVIHNYSTITKIQITCFIYDACEKHLRCFDIVLPFLFLCMNDANTYLRYTGQQLTFKLLKSDYLRLSDAQYLIFMGLFADNNDLIVRHMELFVDQEYVKNHVQLIARNFVPSIIHYNLYTEHPSISLTSSERKMLKETYAFETRCCVHYNLFRHLPADIRFKILNQMNDEILVRILNGTLPGHVLKIVKDALVVILLQCGSQEIVSDYERFYEAMLIDIQNKFSQNIQGDNDVHKESTVVLQKLLVSLFELLYSNQYDKKRTSFSLLYTILSVTKFLSTSIVSIIASNDLLKRHYQRLIQEFYPKIKSSGVSFLKPVNPFAEAKLLKVRDVGFYVINAKFNVISEAEVNSYSNPRPEGNICRHFNEVVAVRLWNH